MTDKHKATWLKQQIAAAEHLQLSAGHAAHALAASYDASTQRIHVQMSNGAAFSFPPQLAQGLAGATEAQWADMVVSPMGTGLHWPQLDADLSVQALLEGVFGSRAWRRAHAARAGSVKSQAKALAARANGAKGGRPKKRS